MGVTQKQLAEVLGLSQVAVSNALQGKGRIAPETRSRVLETAREMGYRLHTYASAIRGTRLNCVGILQSTRGYRSSFFGGALFDGICAGLAPREIHVTVSNVADEKLTDENYVPKILREVMADGLLINYFADLPSRLVELITLYRIPAVWINSRQRRDCVYVDDGPAAEEAVRRLVALGHRRIGYVDFETPRVDDDVDSVIHYSVHDRYCGYVKAVHGAGLSVDAPHKGEPPTLEQRRAVVRNWLKRKKRPTAVVCYSEISAGTILHVAMELGLRIPQDLSVIAFGSAHQLAPFGCVLDRMNLDWQRLGREASQMLLRRMAEDGEPQASLALPAEYIPGETVAPPAC